MFNLNNVSVQVNDVAFGIINKKTGLLLIFCLVGGQRSCAVTVAAVAHLDALLLRLWGLLLRLELTEI